MDQAQAGLVTLDGVPVAGPALRLDEAALRDGPPIEIANPGDIATEAGADRLRHPRPAGARRRQRLPDVARSYFTLEGEAVALDDRAQQPPRRRADRDARARPAGPADGERSAARRLRDRQSRSAARRRRRQPRLARSRRHRHPHRIPRRPVPRRCGLGQGPSPSRWPTRCAPSRPAISIIPPPASRTCTARPMARAPMPGVRRWWTPRDARPRPRGAMPHSGARRAGARPLDRRHGPAGPRCRHLADGAGPRRHAAARLYRRRRPLAAAGDASPTSTALSRETRRLRGPALLPAITASIRWRCCAPPASPSRHGRLVSGGSTLTMQVARLLEGRPDRAMPAARSARSACPGAGAAARQGRDPRPLPDARALWRQYRGHPRRQPRLFRQGADAA